ncbi:GMC oxidoreductase [Saccharata proteae CBS 121410]|uniref:GMC oxidoreductase n=1 Tax=Saccharata proteae CBS 121410 TaxID=1314787 RepID=A0A9P4LUC8_9PEZI|nr:GMC oxidoreductase [Saccharata proteae CBS 121410]
MLTLLPLLLSAFLTPAISAAPTTHEHRLRARQLLGSHFGIPGIDETYDYVVVGGGTAGLTIAYRLAEDGSNSVAVVEAGNFYEITNGNLSQIPGNDIWWTGTDLNDTNPLVDWGYHTTPQPGANGRKLHYARGKCLGGSSARNYMAYHRGTKQSYQLWADTVGDQAYAYENFVPFFEKSVNFTPPDTELRAPNATVQYNPDVFSPTGGPLHVGYPHYGQPWSSWSKLGLNEIGIPTVQDFNSGELLGVQYSTATLNPDDSTRSSSESSFLQTALKSGRTNLQVYVDAMAKRILFDDNKRATGVEIDSAGAKATLSASKEVVVSGGVFGSPQLLMVSGVGPEETLSKLDIPIIAALPGVGQNMWDHIFQTMNYRVNVNTASSVAPNRGALSAQFNNGTGTGILTNPGGDLLGWEKLPSQYRSTFSNGTEAALADFPADWPEIEYLPLAAYTGYNRNYITNQPTDGYQYTSMDNAIITPLSRGTVTIVSNDTRTPPLIDPNYLDHPADRDLAIAAFKRTRQFFATPSIQSIVIGDEYLPGPSVQTDEEILDFIREQLVMLYHGSCTCKMGKEGDAMAVVDSKARVFGVEGLRVVDASSMPFLVPGHPMATIYALAEKIAHDMLTDGYEY